MTLPALVQGLVAFVIVALGQPSFVPFLGPVAAIFGYALIWKVIRAYPSKTQRFWKGALWYFAISIVQLSWMTSIEYQGIYILFVWLGLSIWLGLQFGLLSIMIPHNRQLTFPRILAISAAWTLLEWSRYSFICGYSWNLSGLALSNGISIQFAAIFGILGLSFWVILTNLLGLNAIHRKRAANFGAWVGVATIPYLFGLWHMGYHSSKMGKCEEKLNCVLVQTGVLPPEKIPIQGKIRSFISPYDQWEQILTYVAEHREKSVDLIVLPEAAVPFSLDLEIYDRAKVIAIFEKVLHDVNPGIFPKVKRDEKVSNAYFVQALSIAFDSEVVIGLDYVGQKGDAYNAAFFAQPNSSKLKRYDKQILMPLAEYLPCRFLTPLVRAYGITDFFTPGSGPQIFEGVVPMSPSICYEETFPSKVREGRLLGAKLFVNVTNDGWYPFSRLASQHFEHARFRSVENGVPLIRACNTGVSAALDSLGRTVAKLDEKNNHRGLQRGALFAEISTYDYFTLFAIWGNSAIVGISFLFLGLFLVLKRMFQW